MVSQNTKDKFQTTCFNYMLSQLHRLIVMELENF